MGTLVTSLYVSTLCLHAHFPFQMSQQALDADKVLNSIREQVERLEIVHSEREQVGEASDVF